MGLEDDKVVITSTFDNDKGNMTVSREVMDDQLIQVRLQFTEVRGQMSVGETEPVQLNCR